jgi:hypothetical protein
MGLTATAEPCGEDIRLGGSQTRGGRATPVLTGRPERDARTWSQNVFPERDAWCRAADAASAKPTSGRGIVEGPWHSKSLDYCQFGGLPEVGAFAENRMVAAVEILAASGPPGAVPLSVRCAVGSRSR